MNNGVQLPTISGKWIWLKSLHHLHPAFALMRKEFDLPFSGGDMTLWISANSSYVLYINGRLIGAGPQACHIPGEHLVDHYDVGYYLEPGNNLIAVQVGYDVDHERGDLTRVPGLWCQLADSSGEILHSDESWQIFPADCFSSPRAKISPQRRMTQYVNEIDYPTGWNMQDSKVDETWLQPDLVHVVGTPGTQLRVNPLDSGTINSATIPFKFEFRGKISSLPVWSDVRFPAADKDETYGGVSYIFSETAESTAVQVYSDAPLKFYCNRQLVTQGKFATGETHKLLLAPGWNRLMVFSQPFRDSMGILMIFPEKNLPLQLKPQLDMIETAPGGWCISAAPLKMPLQETSAAVRLERLELNPQESTLGQLADPFDLLNNAQFELNPNGREGKLSAGDFIVFRQENMRYGFIRLNIMASAGDVIDIVSGIGLTPDGKFLRTPDPVSREIITLKCRNGENEFVSQRPQDSLYLAVYVRTTRRGVKITQAGFEELGNQINRECSFNCSDEFFNQLWEAGRQKLMRTSAFVPPAESRPHNDCYLLDSYIDAINTAAVFGNAEYIQFKLRQFIEAQLEDGSIPALSFGRCHASQLPHLFFLPNWILYNYRYTTDEAELLANLPALDALREYFESLLNDETALLDPALIPPVGDAHDDYFTANRRPLVLNSLYCRFMLSSADVYNLVNRKDDEQHCLRAAQAMAEAISIQHFDSELKLFADSPLSPQTEEEFSLFGNFCAMLAGVHTQEYFGNFFHAFFDFDPPVARSPEAESPYFNFMFWEMLFALKQQDWGYKYFRAYWEKKIAEESSGVGTSESYTSGSTGFTGGKCLSPNIFILREIVGVRIAEPGHSAIFFHPAYQQLDMAEAVVPMIRGRFRVKWLKLEDGSLDITLDSDTPIKVVPELPPDVLSNTTFRLGDEVTLLSPNYE